MGQNQISINATMPFSFKPCYNKDLKENGGREWEFIQGDVAVDPKGKIAFTWADIRLLA